MTRLIIIFATINMLTSCTANYFITVRQDGSATANVDREPSSPDISQFHNITDVTKYYKSGIISKIDTTTAGRITFDIKSIDSLGHYLPFHPAGFVQFKMDNNILTVTDGHTSPFKVNEWSCCHVYMVIKLDKDIQEMKSTYRHVKKKDSRTVQLSKSRRQLLKGKKRINLSIKT